MKVALKESLDVFFNSCFLGIIDMPENATRETISKSAQKLLPRKTVTIKKEIIIPHKSISLIEKIYE